MTISEHPPTPSPSWQTVQTAAPVADWSNAPLQQPAQWTQIDRFSASARPASGFDRDLKIGTVFLVVSLVMFPIVFGPAAAYYGYRSHKAGNPAGQIFAVSSIAITVLNITFVAMVLLPRILA